MRTCVRYVMDETDTEIAFDAEERCHHFLKGKSAIQLFGNFQTLRERYLGMFN